MSQDITGHIQTLAHFFIDAGVLHLEHVVDVLGDRGALLPG